MKKKYTWLILLSVVLFAAAVVLLIAVSVRGGELRGIFDFSWLFGTESTAAESDNTENTDDTKIGTEDSSSEETLPPSEASAETDPSAEPSSETEQELSVIRLAVTEAGTRYDPFSAVTETEKNVVQLTQLKLLTLDRNGLVVLHAIEGEQRTYNGVDYEYSGPADIDSEYDEALDITTYHITLRDDLYFADGVKATADDLIFTYYVMLQPQYEGPGSLSSLDIVGLYNYYYNNSSAELIRITEEELDERLARGLAAGPEDAASAYILSLIRTTLEDEMKICEATWQQYQRYGSGNSATEFFYNLYGLDVNYSLPGKSEAQVCADVIAQYGMDYLTLADRYACDRQYFDGQIRSYVRELLQYEKIAGTDGSPVDHISGICRTGELSVDISLYGKDSHAIYTLLDVPIAPMHYYGQKELYDYDAHSFGFVRGAFSLSDKQHSLPLGAGPYCGSADGSEADNEVLLLKANSFYYGGCSSADAVSLLLIDSEGYSGIEEALAFAIYDGKADIVTVDGSKDLYAMIRFMNANGELSGEKILSTRYDAPGYSYIGINTEEVKVGNDSNSTASKALRKALATLLAAYREIACTKYYGDSATVIDYPVSAAYFASPHVRDEDYRLAYSLNQIGSEIYYPQMTAEEKLAAALDACKGYLRLAGYTFDEAKGMVIDAPEGASLHYEILVCEEKKGDSPAYEMLDFAKTVLYSLGISLNIRSVSSEAELWIALNLENVQLWYVSVSSTDPDFRGRYHSASIGGSGLNYYRLNDSRLDSLLDELQPVEDSSVLQILYRQCMELVLDSAAEIPCFQKQYAVLYRTESFDEASLPTDLTSNYNVLDVLHLLEVKHE